ncbi:unnamed protein product [Dibothriocephalus latus]|uniref:Uncharacterized protein n=1 Tax=Dibothriocephalus latus TaxID=60516 RepID=A0A3P7NH33_DIBLA|nr:unnamed protein product [Dibothriocephalus latus]
MDFNELDVDKVEIEIAEEADRLAAEELVCPGSLLPPSSCVESSSQDKEKTDDHEEEGPTNAKMLMETFLTQLPNCVNRDLIDRVRSSNKVAKLVVLKYAFNSGSD